MIITGAIFVGAAIVLLLLVHMAVAVVAAVLMLVVGMSSFQAARKAKAMRCPDCGLRS
jgi:hypothetical protein